jgi:predicted DNA-binding transcriptional regulator YafY
MSNTVLLADEFQPRADFDLKTYWKAAAAELMARGRGYVTVLALSPETVNELGRWRQVRRVPLPPNSVPLPEKWGTFSADFDDEQQALFCVLGLGSNVTVVEPPGLKARVLSEIRRTLERLSSEKQ